MMQLMQMTSSPAQSRDFVPAPDQTAKDSKELSKEATEFAALIQGSQAQALASVPAAAEKSQETSQAAASLNTAALMAGQQPWSKNWVFQGGDQNPELKPLIGDALRSDPQAMQNAIELAQQNAPRSLMDLLAQVTDAKDAGEVRKSELAREIPQSATVPRLGEQAELQLSALSMPRAAALLAEMGQVKASDFLPPEDAELAGLDSVSDLAERRGLEAGEGLSQTMGKSAFAGRPDELRAQIPGVMSRSQLVSGADFLNMKPGMKGGAISDFDQKDELNRGKQTNGADALALSAAQAHTAQRPTGLGPEVLGTSRTEVTGYVVPGAGTRDRLSSESVLGISQNLMRLGAQGGGEIRLRLKPDALGEVRIGVLSHGNSVSLQIHALDEKAKRIVEESLGSLKEALASHALTLANVDLQVAHPVLPSHQQMGAEMDQGQRQNQNAFNGFEGQRQDRGQSESRSDRVSRENLSAGLARTQAFAPVRSAEGRLDVRA